MFVDVCGAFIYAGVEVRVGLGVADAKTKRQES